MKHQWKKVLSVMLVIALVITMVPLQSAQAATKPKLNTTKKTILVGSKVTLKVKNAVKTAKYTWKSSNKTAVTVNQKGVVTGKAGGESIISCKVKTSKQTYTLKANIVVKDSAVVTKQEELNKALQNEAITKIKIKTEDSKKFKITTGDYKNKLLIVEAPNADVSNNGGVFKKIAIRSIKPSTWIERANGNKFSISAPESRIVIGKTASVKTISFTKAGAEAKVDVRGNVGKVVVNKSIDLNIVGSTKEVKVEVASTATGVKIVANVPVDVTAKTNITLELGKGAEGSKVKTTNSNIKVEVKNDTDVDIVVSTPDGEKIVNAGATSDSKDTATDNNTTTGDSFIGSGSSFDNSWVPVPVKKYELQNYGTDFTITAAEGLTAEDITVNAKKWEIRLNKNVVSGAAVTVKGTSVLVNGEVIANLSDKVAITGTDANGNVVDGTATLTWKVGEKTAEGIYRVLGTLGMPTGWSNTYGRGIALSIVITSLVPDNLYNIQSIGVWDENFILTPAEPVDLAVTVTSGAVTISSEEVLNGNLLSIEEGKLKYNGEVIGTLPTQVWVGGWQIKDNTKYKDEQLTVSWQNLLRYDSVSGNYSVVARIVTNENWLNTSGQGATMQIILKSNAVEVKDIAVWQAEDAVIFATNCLPEGTKIADAVIASGSAIKAVGQVKVEVDKSNRTTIKYTLTGTLPKMEVGGNFELGHYVLYSLEKANVNGVWSVEGIDDTLTQVYEGAIYGFSGDKVVSLKNLKHLENKKEIVIYLDVDRSKTFTAGDIKYVIDCSGINLAE